MDEEVELHEEPSVLLSGYEDRTSVFKQNITRRRVFIGCCILFVLLIVIGGSFGIGYLTGSIVADSQDKYVLYNYHEVYPDRDNPKQADIMDTREYQATLNNDDYVDRMSTIRDMMPLLRNLTGEYFTEEDWDIAIYEERQYSTSRCGVKYSELRRRKFYDENGEIQKDKTTIDINMDEPIKEDALTKWDLTPSDDYKSEQKIEHDVHTSRDKFNIKAKIKKLPTHFSSVRTCGDVSTLFPYCFDEDVDLGAEITTSGRDKYIWDYSYSDYMFFGTSKVKLSWTLYYDTLAAAMDYTKAPTHRSEFSIRIYSPNKGMGPFQRESLDFVASIYRGVVDYTS